MRARLVRPAVGLASVAALLLATGASAAPNKITLTDVKGDANAINGQTVVPVGGDVSTGPVQKADADLVSIAFASSGVTKTVKGKKVFTCTGFTVTVELAAPAGSASNYRVLGTGVVNSAMFWLQYNNGLDGKTTTIRHDDGSRKSTPLVNEAKVAGNRIVFTVTEKDLKAAGEKLAKFTMGSLGADVRSSAAGFTIPSFDRIEPDDTKSFSPCK